MINRNLSMVLLGLFFASQSYAQLITNFGEEATNLGGWSWDSGSSTISGTETTGSLLSGSGDLTLDISGASAISITANVTTAPASGFVFLLEDVDFNTASAVFDWQDFIGGNTVTAAISVDIPANGFNFSNVINWNLISGSSNASIVAVLTSASAIPEPATWAVMLGGTALFMVVGRRRRRTAA